MGLRDSNMQPVLSVVMPAYNAEKTILNAMMSIKNQTFQDWELIIIDDGSTDDTLFEASKFAALDNRIKVINQHHEGIAGARNEGCSLAKSKIIVTQDADDLSLPDRLEKVKQTMDTHIFDVIYHGAYLNMWDKGFNCITRKYLPAIPFEKEKLLEGQYTNGWYIFRKFVWEQKPFRMETQYAYDYMAILDWAYSGITIGALNIGLYEYVRHDNSASIWFEKEGLRKQSMDDIHKIMEKEYGVQTKN